MVCRPCEWLDKILFPSRVDKVKELTRLLKDFSRLYR